MQANPWADMLTEAPKNPLKNQAMPYAPSSPHSSPSRSLSQAPRALPTSAALHTDSSGGAQQTQRLSGQVGGGELAGKDDTTIKLN